MTTHRFPAAHTGVSAMLTMFPPPFWWRSCRLQRGRGPSPERNRHHCCPDHLKTDYGKVHPLYYGSSFSYAAILQSPPALDSTPTELVRLAQVGIVATGVVNIVAAPLFDQLVVRRH